MRTTVLFILLLACTGAKSQVADKRLAGIETELNRVLSASKASSFAIAIVEKNKLIYAKGFGKRNLEDNLPADANTLYAIGSCTKAFTSTLVGMLQQEGKVDIDKPVRTYLPQLEFYNDYLTAHITLRDMMCHRTGLPRHDVSWYLFPTDDRDSLLKRIKYMEPTYGLREKWQYNNFMFFAQGALVEKLTGMTWEDNMRRKLFTPMGMTRSNMPYSAVKNDSNLAVAYNLRKDSTMQKLHDYNIGGMGPAGAVYSSVTEMANWLITWINGGKFNGKEIIPAAYLPQASGSQMVVSSSRPDSAHPNIMLATYGFGWFISSYKGHYQVSHGGNIDGFSALTCFYPTDSIGIVVLTNQNGSWVPDVATSIASDRMLSLAKTDWVGERLKAIAKGKKTMDEAKNAGTTLPKDKAGPTHPLKAYEGLFTHPGYGTIEVKIERDSLFAYTVDKKTWLENFTYDAFAPYILEDGEKIDTSDRSSTLRFLFNANAMGEIESIKVMGVESPDIDIIFHRTQKTASLSKEVLEGFTGDYMLAGVTAKVSLKEDKLYVFIPGQPEYELVALDEKDKFKIKVLTGYFVQFERNEKQEVSALSFVQPNGTFKATKK